MKGELDLIKKALFAAKFALEQDSDGEGKEQAIQEIRNALDAITRLEQLAATPGNERNPLLVDTLSHSLADPFDDERPTHIIIKGPKK